MATLGHAGRVGLVITLAVVAAVIGWYFFNQNQTASRTYTIDVLFADAHGITKDVPVQLAGVQVGTVDKITLTRADKADLRLKIEKRHEIPRGSKFLITMPLLGTTGAVTIVPPPDAAVARRGSIHPGEADLVGQSPADFTASVNKANALLDQLNLTARSLNALVADQKLQHQLQDTVANVNAASANGLRLTNRLNDVLLADNAQVQSLLRETRGGAQAALGNIDETTAQVNDTVRENRAQIKGIVADLRDTTSAVSGITAQTNQMLGEGGVTKNLAATVNNLKETTDNLNTAAASIAQLTTDTGVQSDLRETVRNLRESSESTKLLLDRLNQLAGTKRKTAAVIIGPNGAVIVPPSAPKSNAVPLRLPRADFLFNTRTHHFRTDVEALVPIGGSPGTFGRLGIYGLGDTNKLTVQYGKTLGANSLLDYRVGLYASKLSVGGDYGLGRDATASFDLYNPNKFHLDARGVLMLNPELGLTLGAEDITRRSGGIIGLEYRRSQ